MYQDNQYNSDQLKVVVEARAEGGNWANIDDLDPAKYDYNQMQTVACAREGGVFGNIDELDPQKYDQEQMFAIALGRGFILDQFNEVDDLDPSKFSGDHMTIISKERGKRTVKPEYFDQIDLKKYDKDNFEKLIDCNPDLTNIVGIEIIIKPEPPKLTNDGVNSKELLDQTQYNQWQGSAIPDEVLEAIEMLDFTKIEGLREKNNINYMDILSDYYSQLSNRQMKDALALLIVDQRRHPKALEILLDTAKNSKNYDDRIFALMGLTDDHEIFDKEFEYELNQVERFIKDNNFITYANWLHINKGKKEVYHPRITELLNAVTNKDYQATIKLANSYRNGIVMYQNKEKFEEYLALARTYVNESQC